MADKKISELTALTGANVATDDQLVIVDTSAALTKSITIDEFKNALDTATGFVRITGDTMTGDLSLSGADVTFGDNDKAIFGAGSDLQIYHDGSNSYIDEAGTGNLRIRASSAVNVQTRNAGDTAWVNSVIADDGLGVRLFTNGSKKLETTSTGIDVTGNATFADNGKAIFGAGSNLQIYHDGTHNYIEDTSTGNLYIQGTNLILKNQGGTENLADFVSNGAVTLYYDNAAKLATTSTGVDITGVLSSDGLTVEGTTGVTISGAFPMINFGETDTTDENSRVRVSAGDFRIDTVNDAYGSGKTRFLMDNATGDISFYEDTGSTAKLFWDASEERLGIGTTSPSAPLNVQGSAGEIRLQRPTASQADWSLKLPSSGGEFTLYDNNNTAERMRITSSGNVGIGTDSPSDLLELSGDTAQPAIRLTDADVSGLYHRIFTPTNTGLAISADTGNVAADSFLRFDVDGTERMRLDSSGNVGIGTSPQSFAKLQVKTDTNKQIAMFSNTDGATIGGITDIGGSTTLRLAGAPLIMTGGGGSGSEAMRIDSSGNLLVGTTTRTNLSNGTGNDGHSLDANGAARHTTDGSETLLLNRLTSDGDIAVFRKDGTTVGSIGTHAGDYLTIGEGASGLIFNVSTSSVRPWNMDNTTSADGVMNLGSSNGRFKDLYLSGGVFLGGTGSANKLNDYEYGFFEPTFGGTSTNPSGVTYDPTVGNEGYYVKIGKAVFVQINIRTDAISNVGSGNLLIQGLPFAAASVSGQGGVGSFAVSQSTAFSGEAPSAGYVSEGLSYISLFYRTGASAGSIVSECSDLRTIANSNLIRLSGTYYSTE